MKNVYFLWKYLNKNGFLKKWLFYDNVDIFEKWIFYKLEIFDVFHKNV